MNENKELTTAAVNQTDTFTQPLPGSTPMVDVYENEEEILLQADLPGVKKEDISIHIDNGKMVLTGQRHMSLTGAQSWQEFAETEFRRHFSIPQSIEVEKVHAELKDGVLRLHLPKSDAAKPRQIEITAV